MNPSALATEAAHRFARRRRDLSVSVALCTYDGARWLPPFFESLAAQEEPPAELVVQDDGSSDGSVDVVADFARRAPFPVRLEVNTARLGSTHNFATALGRCAGPIVALADQDDVWFPGKLARVRAEFAADPTITMVFSDAELIGEDGQPLHRRLWDTRMVSRTLRRHEVVPETLFARRALTTGCTVAVRRRAVEAALPFPALLDDERAPLRHDRWLSLVAASVGTVRALPEPLLAFRVHPSQQTGVLVGPALGRALGRAASDVVRGRPGSGAPFHRTRAAQLRLVADRAEAMGDFAEAAGVRRVADHHDLRAAPRRGVVRLRAVAGELRAGAYGTDPLALAGAGADLVRAVRPGRWTTEEAGGGSAGR